LDIPSAAEKVTDGKAPNVPPEHTIKKELRRAEMRGNV